MTHLVQQCGEIVESIRLPEDTAGNRVFSAVKIPSCSHHRIGKDASGNIVVLIAVDPARATGALPPVFLEHLAVLHSVRCKVTEGQGPMETGLFTVVRCASSDKGLRHYFITVITSIVMTLQAMPSCDEAAGAIGRMIQLFRALAKPNKRSLQGLWGELYVIRRAAEPLALARAWHVDPYEEFDFADGELRIEVKSTRRGRRSHIFSLVQLRPAMAIQSVIASLRVQPSSGGPSIGELWEELRAIVQEEPEILVHVDRVVTTSLGRTWRRGIERRFDLQTATSSIAFFMSRTIPSVNGDLPPEVSDVKFRSDLSLLEPTLIETLRSLGGLFAACIPRGT